LLLQVTHTRKTKKKKHKYTNKYSFFIKKCIEKKTL